MCEEFCWMLEQELAVGPGRGIEKWTMPLIRWGSNYQVHRRCWKGQLLSEAVTAEVPTEIKSLIQETLREGEADALVEAIFGAGALEGEQK